MKTLEKSYKQALFQAKNTQSNAAINQREVYIISALLGFFVRLSLSHKAHRKTKLIATHSRVNRAVFRHHNTQQLMVARATIYRLNKHPVISGHDLRGGAIPYQSQEKIYRGFQGEKIVQPRLNLLFA